jgi:aminopeptidase YwaD
MLNRPRLTALWIALIISISLAAIACGDAPDAVSDQVQPTATTVATAAPNLRHTAASKPEPTSPPIPLKQPSTVASTSTPVPANPDVKRLSHLGMELLTKFTEDHSPRESGSDDERAAAEFIGAYLENLGYHIEFQPLEVDYIAWSEDFVSLIGDDMPDLRAVPMAMTGLGDVSAPLVSVGRALEEDMPDSGLQGVIALIERGEITFEEKISRVADGGAVGAIIYNNERGNFRGALQSEGPIPATSLSRQQGEEVLRLIETEPGLEARIKIEKTFVDSQNVIAELDNQATECGTLILGGHYDSVANTQAAGDNGTGVVSLLVMAEELAKAHYDDGQPLPYAVRLVFFGVEEIGLFGSKHYVDELSKEERDEIIAMLNFDAMGKGNASVVGSEDILDRTIEYATDNGIDLNRSNESGGFGSDHASFINADIPALFFYGDDFSIINSPEDVLEQVDPNVMGINMAVSLGILQHFECKLQE